MRLRRSEGVEDVGYDSQRDFFQYLGAFATAYGNIREKKVHFLQLEERLKSFPTRRLVPSTDAREQLLRSYHSDEQEVVTKDLLKHAHNIARDIACFRRDFPTSMTMVVKDSLDELEARLQQYIPAGILEYRRRFSPKKAKTG